MDEKYQASIQEARELWGCLSEMWVGEYEVVLTEPTFMVGSGCRLGILDEGNFCAYIAELDEPCTIMLENYDEQIARLIEKQARVEQFIAKAERQKTEL